MPRLAHQYRVVYTKTTRVTLRRKSYTTKTTSAKRLVVSAQTYAIQWAKTAKHSTTARYVSLSPRPKYLQSNQPKPPSLLVSYHQVWNVLWRNLLTCQHRGIRYSNASCKPRSRTTYHGADQTVASSVETSTCLGQTIRRRWVL